jgi:hypothetical protein
MFFLDRAAMTLTGDASPTRSSAPVERACRLLAGLTSGLVIAKGY